MTQQIRTAEELDALPVGKSAVVDRDGDVWMSAHRSRWVTADVRGDVTPEELVRRFGPLMVLHPRPDAPAPVDQGDREALVRAGTDLMSLARAMYVRATGRPEAWDLNAYCTRGPWLSSADVALAWFAAQPKAVTAEEVEQAEAAVVDVLDVDEDTDGLDLFDQAVRVTRAALAALNITVEGGAEVVQQSQYGLDLASAVREARLDGQLP